MKRVFIGHRGTGKSKLLKRHQSYFSNIAHFDLDHEIETAVKHSVSDFFKLKGESEFRKVEIELYQKITSSNSEFVITLGAGFDVSTLSQDIEIVYVSRMTDRDGRIFLNRPRLHIELDPIEEYLTRYQTRQPQYLKCANRIYFLDEGIDTENSYEKLILQNNFIIEDAYYTLAENDLKSLDQLIKNYKKIELRTDLLKKEVIESLLKKFLEQDWLVSIRTDDAPVFVDAKVVDCDVKYKYTNAQIISSHEENIDAAILKLAQYNKLAHLKLCPVVESFDELVKGYRWQIADASNRSFLPRSKSGKWIWYRQLSKYFQKINFIKSFTLIDDQPSLYQWLSLPKQKPVSWAAVLGQPVYFSRSPAEHLKYFAGLNTFFTKVDLSKEELQNYFKFLVEIGLKYAAVTSPLKETAWSLSYKKTSASEELKSANTLYVKSDEIYSHNTDLDGFKELTKSIKPNDKIAVWGGGGTLDMMKRVLPEAHFFSSQTGQLRSTNQIALVEYDYLIWAAPRSEFTSFPTDNIRINAVIDLNYRENSMGLEFAAYRKINYTSGLNMFKLQASKQRDFWSDGECK
jgi:shikimate kinase